MSLDMTISRDDAWYLGEDKTLSFTIYTDATQAACHNVSGFSLSWKLAPKPGETAVVTKATGGSGVTITGTFNADPDVNTQRILVVIDDTDTDALTATTYTHELKRTDTGLEAVLAQGRVTLLRPVHTS